MNDEECGDYNGELDGNGHRTSGPDQAGKRSARAADVFFELVLQFVTEIPKTMGNVNAVPNLRK